MKSLRAFLRLVRAAPGGAAVAGLFALMIAAGLMEGVGILLLVPLLALLGGGGAEHGLAREILAGLAFVGLPRTAGGLLTAFLALVALRGAAQYARERARQQPAARAGRPLAAASAYAALLGVGMALAGQHAPIRSRQPAPHGRHVGWAWDCISASPCWPRSSPCWPISRPPSRCRGSMTALAVASGSLVFWLLSGQRNKALKLGQQPVHRQPGASRQRSRRAWPESRSTKILGSEARHRRRTSPALTTQLRQEQVRFAVEQQPFARTVPVRRRRPCWLPTSTSASKSGPPRSRNS